MHDDQLLDDDQDGLRMGRRLAQTVGSVALAGSLVFGAAACGDDDAEVDPVEDEVENEVEDEVEEEIERGEEIEDEVEQELEEEILEE